MNGRDSFKRYEKLIRLMVLVSNFIPKFLFDFMWNITSVSESKVAILIRYLYAHKYTSKCGVNVFIGKHVILKNIDSLVLGNNISIHAFSYLDSYGGIEIGSDVSIANHTSIISFNHTYEDEKFPIKYNPVIKGKITIDSDVWIGNGVRILPNVRVGSRSVVAAGAVVTKAVPEKCIVGGIPAKLIKQL